jgi:membrane protease YdiL (CAAX protease family)
LSTAVGLTLAAGLLGLLTNRSARALGWRFPSTGYLVGELIWNLGTLGLLLWAIHRVTHDRIDPASLGLSVQPQSPAPYPVRLAVVVGAVAAVVAILTGASATNANTYGRVHHVGLALGLAEIVIRYPLTVLAEEALFRGWMQPRLGSRGPVLSALLWACYHLQQVSTIPSLVIFGLVLGFLRWWKGNVRASGVLHYCSDAIFFLSNYL